MAPPSLAGRKRKSPADRATVAAGFVTGMLSGLGARGIDPHPLLRAAGIPASVLRDRRARVPIAAYVALYNAVVRTLDDEGFALFAAPLRPGTFEFLCRASAGSATLGEALDRAARFLALVLPDLAVRVSRSRGVARLEIAERRRLRRDAADPRRVFAFEWLLRLLHGLACWLAGRGIALQSVRFPYPRPAHAADYTLVYTEHSAFDSHTLVAAFDAALLEHPVVRSAADVEAFLEGAPGRISMLYRRDREMVRRVRELLARDLAAAPALEACARSLEVSPRTLHRRLADEGSSFRMIREELRRARALAMIETTRKRIADVAAELGYSEPSAFFRAFHAWTGAAPSAHRRRARRGP
ncbi:MAG TPA: AraC family transcriptional regulator [Usitatibacter sp.]|jgi:AraC-like DNA-binding protein